jgi:hypothetical protein
MGSEIKKICISKDDKHFNWDGTIVAVVGLYDKGKTFVLN